MIDQEALPSNVTQDEPERMAFLQQILSEHGYELMDPIGMGSYGRVYTVLSKKYSGVIFAAKVMTLEDRESNSSTFETEVEILTRLSHPNIVSLFDSFHSGHDCFLILEFCTNGTIEKYIQSQHLSHPHMLNLFRPIISAIAYCHNQGIVLRDIKPANILIDHYGRPKLTDFGLSRIVKVRDSANYAGSLAYMAPELFTNRRDPDLFSADIWSLGVTLYRLLVGDLPWPRMLTASQLIAAIIAGGPTIPRTLAPPVKAVLERMTSRNPLERPSAVELLRDPAFPEIEALPSARSGQLGRPRALAPRIYCSQSGAPFGLGHPNLPKPGEKRGSEVLVRQPSLVSVIPPRRLSINGLIAKK
jgi:serine/threonine protein kinase